MILFENNSLNIRFTSQLFVFVGSQIIKQQLQLVQLVALLPNIKHTPGWNPNCRCFVRHQIIEHPSKSKSFIIILHFISSFFVLGEIAMKKPPSLAQSSEFFPAPPAPHQCRKLEALTRPHCGTVCLGFFRTEVHPIDMVKTIWQFNILSIWKWDFPSKSPTIFGYPNILTMINALFLASNMTQTSDQRGMGFEHVDNVVESLGFTREKSWDSPWKHLRMREPPVKHGL